MNIIVEISARHIHLMKEHLETLFGQGYELTNKRSLSQPGQFLCEEKIEVVGLKGSQIMSILGPVRKDTQIEISLIDARKLGFDAPVRESGDTKGSCGAKLVGPKGELLIEEGVIVAKRHIHLTPEDAKNYNIKDKDLVNVKIEGERSLTFHNTVVRVDSSFEARMHIDTDEAAACGLKGEGKGIIYLA